MQVHFAGAWLFDNTLRDSLQSMGVKRELQSYYFLEQLKMTPTEVSQYVRDRTYVNKKKGK